MQTRVRTLERVGRLKRTSILELGKVPLNGNGNSNGNGNGHAILRGAKLRPRGITICACQASWRSSKFKGES